MQKLGKYAKTPNDNKRYVIEYDDWLDSGETISSYDFTISPTTATPLTVGSVSIVGSSKQLEIFIGGGEDGEDYTVVVQITTSDTQVSEDLINVSVRAAT